LIQEGVDCVQEDVELDFAVELELFVEDVDVALMQEQALEMLSGSFAQGDAQLGRSKFEISLYRIQYADATSPYSWKVCKQISLMQVVLLTYSVARDKLANNGTRINEERIVSIES